MIYKKKGRLPESQRNLDVYRARRALDLADKAELALVRVLDIRFTVLLQ